MHRVSVHADFWLQMRCAPGEAAVLLSPGFMQSRALWSRLVDALQV